jgi:hypothetical protein
MLRPAFIGRPPLPRQRTSGLPNPQAPADLALVNLGGVRRLSIRAGTAVAIAVGAAAVMLEAGGSAPPDPSPAKAGRVHLFREGGPSFARWVHRSDCRRFLNRYHRMRLYSPYADACVQGGYRGGLAYVNAQAIYPREVRVWRRDSRRERHAQRRLDRLILRDARGRRLYVPFECDGRRCPQYAAHIGSRRWRKRIARKVGAALRDGYRGVFLDDVNWTLNVSDGAGRPVRPVHPVTRRPISLGQWRRAMARLVTAIRARHPRAEVVVNSVWWKPESSLDVPDVARGVRAASAYDVERGTLDTFRGQSYAGLLATIDRIHALGTGVNLDNFAARTRREAEFELATYFLISDGRDSVTTDYGSCPSSGGSSPCEEPFWSAYRIDLGEPRGPRRVRADGLVERRFAGGLVLVNPPRSPRREAALDGVYTDLDGARTRRVALAGGEARILRPCASLLACGLDLGSR